ncbi:MAG TPA: patatin-like phospholipase family protein [Bacteroidales bacterium]|nr:patatin-like phospholipase family protein [Bacteroidales bacterium]
MKEDIGLVLSSGGARGATQIGVIKTLEKQGYNIKSVSGASIGSMIAGMYARGDLYEFEQWITSLSEEEILNLLGFTLKKNGILKVDGFFEILNQKFPDKNIEDLNIPCAIAATDIISNKPIYFTKGSLYKAMRASIAIPSLIVPVRYDNTILVDGGVLNPIPIEPLPNRDKLDVFVINLYADEEGKKLIVKEKIENTITQNRRNRRYNAFINRIENFISRANVKNILDYITSSATSADNIGYIQLLNTSAIAMIERIADLTIKAYPPDVIIDIPKDICKALDFGNIKELIEYGEAKTIETLKNIKAK